MVDIPNIRFKEFTDDWEWRKLGKVFHSLQNNTFQGQIYLLNRE